MSAIVIVTTVGTEEQANLLGQELVQRQLAACVNILPVLRSIYRWQGEICSDSEYLLVIKTLEDVYAKVEAAVRELHEYDVPEILAFRVSQGEANFLSWIDQCVKGQASQEEG